MKLASAFVLAAALLATPREAAACVNVTRAEIDAHTRNVKAAGAALESEELAKAQKLATAEIAYFGLLRHGSENGKVHTTDGSLIDAPDPSLLRRAHRIEALARSRSATTPEQKKQALDAFEAVLVEHPDPTLLADYAELLSRVPARAGQATMMLRALVDKDLLGSARAFAALARLEGAAGDTAAEQRARERCRTVAVKKSICDS